MRVRIIISNISYSCWPVTSYAVSTEATSTSQNTATSAVRSSSTCLPKKESSLKRDKSKRASISHQKMCEEKYATENFNTFIFCLFEALVVAQSKPLAANQVRRCKWIRPMLAPDRNFYSHDGHVCNKFLFCTFQISTGLRQKVRQNVL